MATITLDDLYKGKSTMIKNKEFQTTKSFIEPFIDRVSKLTDNFSIKVKTPSQITMDKNNPDITYNRVLVEAILPESYWGYDNHQQVIGCLYGIDMKVPVVKFFKSAINMACLNMCVFDKSMLHVQQIEPGKALNYSGVKSLIEQTEDFGIKIKKLKDTVIKANNPTDRQKHLGSWIDYVLRTTYDEGYGKIKIASSIPITTYEDLFIKEDSPYFCPPGYDPTLFDCYNAFTEQFATSSSTAPASADKDIISKYEKVLMISNMLGV